MCYNNERIQLTHLHPYEYLTSLNSAFASCNKANSKCTSSYSKLKLTWKPFSIMKIPNCFEATYTQKSHKDKVNKVELNTVIDENQRKMWKEHEQILKRHKNKQNKNQYVRPKTGNRREYNPCNTSLSSAEGSANMMLKRLQDKGVKLNYNKSQLESQVLRKLKQIQTQLLKKKSWRPQTAVTQAKKSVYIERCNQASLHPNESFLSPKKYVAKENNGPKPNEYLSYGRSYEIVQDYKQKIKEVDCAISEANIKKAADLLRNMENIVEKL